MRSAHPHSARTIGCERPLRRAGLALLLWCAVGPGGQAWAGVGEAGLPAEPVLAEPVLAKPVLGSPALAGQHLPPTHLPPGYLGIDVHDVSDEEANTLHLHETRGAEIVRVDHDGPAGKMGLRVHDVVLQLNGIVIDGEEPLRRLLREMPPGRTVTLLLNREGLQLIVTAQMADRREVERDAWEQHLNGPAPQAPAVALPTGDGLIVPAPGVVPPNSPPSRYSKSFLGNLMQSPSYTGAMLETIGPQLADFFGAAGQHGLLVRSVADGSPAATAGMRAGDVVVRANSRPIRTVSEWGKQIREAKGRPVPVIILRERQEHLLTLTADGKRRSCLDLPGEASPPPVELASLLEL